MANTHMFTEESVKVVKSRTFVRLGCVLMGKESSILNTYRILGINYLLFF